MKFKRTLIASVTFLGGLYFVLDFVVPQTMPLMSASGVAVVKSPASMTVRNATGQTLHFNLADVVEIQQTQRDKKADLKHIAVKVRDVGVGDKVHVKIREVEIAELMPPTPAGNARVKAKDGKVVELAPGEDFYSIDEAQEKIAATPNEKESIEFRDAVVTQMERGSVTVLADRGGRKTLNLTNNTVLVRYKRNEVPAEVKLEDVRVGDTLTIGPKTTFADNRDLAAQFYGVVGTLAFGMGLFSLTLVNGRTLIRRDKGWFNSALFFIAVVFGVMTGMYKYFSPGTPQRDFSDAIVLQVLVAIGSTIFSLLAFYLASAAYRAFRIRNLEAGLMMASALIVMLGQTPVGYYITAWLGPKYEWLWLPNIAGWILRTPNSAVVRALTFGVMMGAIATAIRYWLNLERSMAVRGDD